jgi:hypothetical protein
MGAVAAGCGLGDSARVPQSGFTPRPPVRGAAKRKYWAFLPYLAEKDYQALRAAEAAVAYHVMTAPRMGHPRLHVLGCSGTGDRPPRVSPETVQVWSGWIRAGEFPYALPPYYALEIVRLDGDEGEPRIGLGYRVIDANEIVLQALVRALGAALPQPRAEAILLDLLRHHVGGPGQLEAEPWGEWDPLKLALVEALGDVGTPKALPLLDALAKVRPRRMLSSSASEAAHRIRARASRGAGE